MPIYEYLCQACGKRFSEYSRSVKASDEGPNPPCPRCASVDTRRLLGSFMIGAGKQVDPAEAAHTRQQEEFMASTTTREQIDAWRAER